jgi:rhamnosyl/mannosyltransferase
METHVRVLARAQADLGADVRVLCVDHADKADPRPGSRVREELDGPVRVARLGRIASIAKLDVCPDIRRALRGLDRDPVDIVHLHVPNPHMLLAAMLFPPRAELVVTHHYDIVDQVVLGAMFRPFEHWCMRRAARIVSTSPTYAGGSRLLARYASKVAVVPLGIDLGAFARPGRDALADAEQLRERYGSPLWLCVGRLVPYKAQATAIEALRHVPGRLMMVGEGPLAASLRQMAQDAGVADRVIWRGAIPSAALIGCYHAATALWFPSHARNEAFGLAQLEAMASGCPVINCAIAHSGVPWVSQHERTGLTVPVDDPLALAAAARRLLDEPVLLTRLREGARLRALSEFDHHRMAARSLDLYGDVLARRGAK